MATVAPPAPRIETLADLLVRLGGIDPRRARFHPPPGTARVQDVIEVAEREGKLCELIEGVLLEKVMGWNESRLAGFILGVLTAQVIPRNLGVVTGADGATELMPDLVRIPDVAFINWDRLPGRRCTPRRRSSSARARPTRWTGRRSCRDSACRWPPCSPSWTGKGSSPHTSAQSAAVTSLSSASPAR